MCGTHPFDPQVLLNKGRPPLQDALRSSTRKVLNFGNSVAKILDSVELDTDSEAEELDKAPLSPTCRLLLGRGLKLVPAGEAQKNNTIFWRFCTGAFL